MEKFSEYNTYTVDDFVQDDEFRNWIMRPDNFSDSYWNEYLRVYPEKAGLIKIARQIVDALLFEEREIKSSEYQGALNNLKKYLDKKSGKKHLVGQFSFWLGRIAVILIVPLLLAVSLLYFENSGSQAPQMVRYIVPNGQKSKVVLADGSSVWLNSGSTLSYSADKKNSRKVFLSGEAFFDVVKDRKHPFLVETGNYTVKVYGTQFNVYDCKKTQESEVILKEGSVSILINNQEKLKLQPGQRFYMNEKKKYTITRVNPDLYLSWKDNVLRINKERLQDLIIRMERWYGVNIRVENFEQVKDLRYTLTIKTESLREMLELIRIVTPFHYEINGENLTLKYY